MLTGVLFRFLDLHWSEDNKAYCDVTVDEASENIHVCHKGYISLYPVLLGLVDPNSEKLGHVLDLMSDPEELWTPYGLRSLSAKDELFGTGENYWKGPIWINLNFLAVHSLKNVRHKVLSTVNGLPWVQCIICA